MKLKEEIEEIDFSDTPSVPDELFSFFDICAYDPAFYDQNRLVEYPVVEWLCTDTPVGLYAVHFDGVLVGIRTRECRGCDSAFVFDSEDSVKMVKNYLLQFTEYDYGKIVSETLLEDDIGYWFNKKNGMETFISNFKGESE